MSDTAVKVGNSVESSFLLEIAELWEDKAKQYKSYGVDDLCEVLKACAGTLREAIDVSKNAKPGSGELGAD